MRMRQKSRMGMLQVSYMWNLIEEYRKMVKDIETIIKR